MRRRREVLGTGLALAVGGLAGCETLPGSGGPSDGDATETADDTEDGTDDSTDGNGDDGDETVTRWPFFQQDLANRGRAGPGPVTGVSQQWTFEGDQLIFSSPVVADGRVYVGRGDGETGAVHAIDAESGDGLWRFDTDAVSATPAVVADTAGGGTGSRTVYVATRAGRGSSGQAALVALDAAEGREDWRVTLDEREVVSSPAVADGTVYLAAFTVADGGSGSGHVYALSASDGSERWRVESDVSYSSPAVVDDTVYIGDGFTGGGAVRALATGDGSERWRTEFETNVLSSPAVSGTASDGTVYVGTFGRGDDSMGGDLYALDAASGAEEWSTGFANGVFGSPAVRGDSVYVGTANLAGGENVLAGLSAADGTERWQFRTEGGFASSPAVSSDTVYVGSYDNNVYALARADGSERWRFEAGARVAASPAVLNDTVYAASFDGNVYALEPGEGDARSDAATSTSEDELEQEEQGEQQVSNRLQVVAATGTSISDRSIGEVAITVKKAPGADDVDLSRVTAQWVGPTGTYNLVASSVDAQGADGHFGIEAFRDEDGSAPVLNSLEDRLVLVFDLGTDDRDVDDTGGSGAGATHFAERLPEGAQVTLALTSTSGATARAQLVVPERLAGQAAVTL